MAADITGLASPTNDAVDAPSKENGGDTKQQEASMAVAIANNEASQKYKASDLPLPSATRSAIDGLVHSFKKKGGYDVIRKQVWEGFEASVSRCSPPRVQQKRSQ